MNSDKVEIISFKEILFAIIVRSKFSSDGISFFTDPLLSQQLAFMKHPKGKFIDPHIHNPVPREVLYTNEVLWIKKGTLRVDFYSNEREFLESRKLYQGDVILLVGGGHGFFVENDVEFFEVKQGPYAGESDKTRFAGTLTTQGEEKL